MANGADDGAVLLGNALFAAVTRKSIHDFTPSARAPDSLPIALEDYVDFRFGRRESTIVLLVDKAQNLHDTLRVRDHLEVLHGGITGDTQVLLACFGLANTTARLAELGLSRLARGHARSIGALSNEDARAVVVGTLDVALANHTFGDGSSAETQSTKWIGEAATAILAESGNFPHHLTNGCCALAELVLDQGIAERPPVAKLRDRCREHRREYYAARLQPWSRHTIALAHAFAGEASEDERWTPADDVVAALMASDNRGRPVDEDVALAVVDGLCATGFVEQGVGALRPLLPSLSSHFQAVRQSAAPDNKVVRAVRAALDAAQ